jgi:hypothetical protein
MVAEMRFGQGFEEDSVGDIAPSNWLSGMDVVDTEVILVAGYFEVGFKFDFGLFVTLLDEDITFFSMMTARQRWQWWWSWEIHSSIVKAEEEAWAFPFGRGRGEFIMGFVSPLPLAENLKHGIF